MKKLTLPCTLVAAVFSLPVAADQPYMPSYVEDGLIKICKTAVRDKAYQMNKAIKDMNLKKKTVALNVVCNGDDIIAFAEKYGAEKTASILSNSIGSVEVTDIVTASHQKWDVTFDVNAN